MVESAKGLGPDKDRAGKSQQHIKKTDPTPHKNKIVTVKE
jgi:hypothetical protein